MQSRERTAMILRSISSSSFRRLRGVAGTYEIQSGPSKPSRKDVERLPDGLRAAEQALDFRRVPADQGTGGEQASRESS